jgi:hypothetical protein
MERIPFLDGRPDIRHFLRPSNSQHARYWPVNAATRAPVDPTIRRPDVQGRHWAASDAEACRRSQSCRAGNRYPPVTSSSTAISSLAAGRAFASLMSGGSLQPLTIPIESCTCPESKLPRNGCTTMCWRSRLPTYLPASPGRFSKRSATWSQDDCDDARPAERGTVLVAFKARAEPEVCSASK